MGGVRGGAPEPARFWPKVSIGAPGECWYWTAKINADGYGTFGRSPANLGQTTMVHRIVHEWKIGPIPAGFDVDHTCHNLNPECVAGVECMHRRCCNPARLEAVPHIVNVHRGQGIAAQRRAQTHCIHGHEFSTENTQWVKRYGKWYRQCRECTRRRKREWARAHYVKKRVAA